MGPDSGEIPRNSGGLGAGWGAERGPLPGKWGPRPWRFPAGFWAAPGEQGRRGAARNRPFGVGIHDVFAHPAKPPRWGTSAGAGALGGAGRSPGEAGGGDPRRFRSKLTLGSDMAGIDLIQLGGGGWWGSPPPPAPHAHKSQKWGSISGYFWEIPLVFLGSEGGSQTGGRFPGNPEKFRGFGGGMGGRTRAAPGQMGAAALAIPGGVLGQSGGAGAPGSRPESSIRRGNS